MFGVHLPVVAIGLGRCEMRWSRSDRKMGFGMVGMAGMAGMGFWEGVEM